MRDGCICVDQENDKLSAVAFIDDAGSVQHSDAISVGQATARANEPHVEARQRDGYPGCYARTAAGR